MIRRNPLTPRISSPLLTNKHPRKYIPPSTSVTTSLPSLPSRPSRTPSLPRPRKMTTCTSSSQTPWQPCSLPAPAWRPPADAHSTSTVTDSGASASPCSSPRDSDSDLSPRDSPPPRSVWPTDEFGDDYELASPFDRKTLSVASRALPRCAVINFSKNGDNLRWAPCATQNASGVAARVHNFEDAFSLEEFSSRALPVVWHARGGNPRLSGSGKEGEEAREEKEIQRTRTKSSLSASQKSLIRPPGMKKTMVIAHEFRRPSFWTLLAHSNKIQKTRAQRLAEKEMQEDQKAARAKKTTSWSTRIRSVLRRSQASKKGEGKRKGDSLFRRIVEKGGTKEVKHPEPKRKPKEEATKLLHVEEKRHADRKVLGTGRERRENVGSIRMKKRAVGRLSADVPKRGTGHRRARSSMGPSKKTDELGKPSSSQDDQYVTFMTSALC